jgi:hypothetical protein
MAFRVQVRRDTGQRWSLNNPILLNGEMGFNTDTNQFKIGNGTTTWNPLSYWTGGVGPAGPTGPIGLIGPTGPTGPGSSVSYKVYTALLTQEGINPPTAIVLENTLGGDVVWSYLSTGVYSGTLTDAFPEDKTTMFITSTTWSGDSFMCMSLYGGNIPSAVAVETFNLQTSTHTNGLLYKTTVEIRVYN